jgi:Anti-sigma-K factor rskA, C-terminal/Putative zinc-finger
MTDHAGHRDDVGAYLLGALNDLERQAFERHLRDCGECQEELDRLRPAAEVLPASVEQLPPPPGLKTRLMAEVEPPRRRGPSRMLAVAAVLLLGLVVAFGVSQLGGDDSRSVTATVAKAMPEAGGQLDIQGDRATLRLHDMPELGGTRVYQVWVQHGDQMVPARTFEVGRDGTGNVRLPDVRDSDGVYVTREPRGGARVPSEDPIVSVPL